MGVGFPSCITIAVHISSAQPSGLVLASMHSRLLKNWVSKHLFFLFSVQRVFLYLLLLHKAIRGLGRLRSLSIGCSSSYDSLLFPVSTRAVMASSAASLCPFSVVLVCLLVM